MLTALLVAKTVFWETHGLQDVNVEYSYHENFTDEEWTKLRQTSTEQLPTAQPLPTVA